MKKAIGNTLLTMAIGVTTQVIGFVIIRNLNKKLEEMENQR